MLTTSQLIAQCASNYAEVCNGSFNGGSFSTFDANIAGSTSCGLGTGNAGFVVFNITTTGILNVNINGSATTGFIDVAIFNIPAGVNPCTAASNSANEIACNYAPAAGGCAAFGNVGGNCNSVVAGPAVTAGDRIIIVVDNFSGSAVTYDVQLYDNSGTAVAGNTDGTDGADAGPPEADIDDATGCIGDAFQVPNTGDYDADNLVNAGGGTYSATCGACVNTTTGLFTATTAGTHTITYEHYSTGDPCYSTDDAIVTIDAVPDIALTCPGALCSTDGLVDLAYVDNNSGAATNGAAIVTITGSGAAFVNANNMFDTAAAGAGSYTITYTVNSVNGLCSDTETCTITVQNCCAAQTGSY